MNTTEEQLDRLKERITLLLNKAENTPYPEEAQTFQEHAERLMVRYGIGHAELDAENIKQGKKSENVIEEYFEVRGTYMLGHRDGLAAVGHAFPAITILLSSNKKMCRLYVIGFESDVQTVLTLFSSLVIQAQSAMAAWWAAEGKVFAWSMTESEKRIERRQFQASFLFRVASRLRELYKEETQHSGSGTELVLVDRKEHVTEFVHEKYPYLRRSVSRTAAGSMAAAMAGQLAGDRADLGLGKSVHPTTRQEVGR